MADKPRPRHELEEEEKLLGSIDTRLRDILELDTTKNKTRKKFLKLKKGN